MLYHLIKVLLKCNYCIFNTEVVTLNQNLLLVTSHYYVKSNTSLTNE